MEAEAGGRSLVWVVAVADGLAFPIHQGHARNPQVAGHFLTRFAAGNEQAHGVLLELPGITFAIIIIFHSVTVFLL